MFTRLAAGVALSSMALVLAGCTPQEPVETTPEPTASPPTASTDRGVREDEVVEAAMAAAEDFYSLVDRAFESGELPAAELEAVATPAAVEKVEAELEQFVALGWQVEGGSILDSPVLEDWSPEGTHSGVAELLVCLDTSGVTTTNAQGEPVGGSEPRQPRHFTLEYRDTRMVVADFGPVTDAVEVSGCGS